MAVLEGWRGKVSADLCIRKGFRGGPWLDLDGTLQLLHSDHVWERQRRCSEMCWWVVSGMVFCLRRLGTLRSMPVLRWYGWRWALFWDSTCPPFVEQQENP